MDEKRERLTVRLSGWFKGRSALEIVFLAVFILGFVHYAGSKHVLHRHESSSCVRLVDGQSHGQTILPTVDSDAHELFPSYTNAVTDFRVTGFRKGETSAFLRATWPANFLLPNWSVDVFACSGITSNSWTDVGRAAWDFSGNELTVEVPFFLLPESDAASMFFVLGLCFDTDGDGLTDAFEKLVSKTSPFRRDTDGDGLSDGWEVYMISIL